MPANKRQLGGGALMFLAGVAMAGGGVFEVVVQKVGTKAMAQITDCRDVDGRVHAVVCEGTWIEGDLVNGGHVEMGTVDGAQRSDVGQTIPVHLAGGRAYVPSIRIPLILLGFGVAMVAYGVQLARGGRSA